MRDPWRKTEICEKRKKSCDTIIIYIYIHTYIYIYIYILALCSWYCIKRDYTKDPCTGSLAARDVFSSHTYRSIRIRLAAREPPQCRHKCVGRRGGGLGSRPKKMYGETLGDGVEYHLMSPTPRRKVPFTTGRRAY